VPTVNAWSLLGGIVFSGIGLAALTYGKRQGLTHPMLVGAALMVYPYFVADTLLTFAVGLVLTGLLFAGKR